MKKNDLLTPIGLVLGFAMIMFGIINNSGIMGATSFIDFPSLLIVLGGTIGALLITFNMKEMQVLPGVMKQVFSKQENELSELIHTFVKLSDRARREGLLALEAELDDVNNDFLKKVSSLQ